MMQQTAAAEIFPPMDRHTGMAMLVTTVIDGTMKLYDLMQNNRLDAAFVNDSTVINKNIYQFTPIVSSPFCAIVNTLDSLSVKEEITPADLAGKNLLLPDRNSSIGNYMYNCLKEQTGKINILGSCSQVDTCINTAVANLGISFITRDIAANYADRSIRLIPLSPPIIRTTGVLAEKQKLADPILASFLDYTKNYFQIL